MLKQREWKYITDFITNNDFPDQFEWGDKAMLLGGDLCDWPLWNQLNVLWIAFCIHQNLEPDTREYDLRLMSIFGGTLGVKETLMILTFLWVKTFVNLRRKL